jgi:tetratricopeptide (TPR) repeat protein
MREKLTIEHAISLLNSHKLEEGQRVLKKLLIEEPNNIHAHQLLVKIGFNSKNLQQAEKHLIVLLEINPLSQNCLSTLIELYTFQKKWPQIASIYLNIAKKQPNNAISHFNCGYYFKLSGEFDSALDSYNKALAIGIEKDYEVSLNIATIYSEHLSKPAKAIDILTLAINKHPDQDSLLYNLANLYEQLGNKEQAFSNFQLAFAANPNNLTALARQADIYKVDDKEHKLIKQLKTALTKHDISDNDKININYALGKAHDDCLEHELGFKYYSKANELDKKTLPKYERKKFEKHIDDIISTFNSAWFNNLGKNVENSYGDVPTFICGMFRSGSTLCEQILSGHSNISIGGEQEFFHRYIINNHPDFPVKTIDKILENKKKLVDSYLKEIGKFQLSGSQLTDKRPDNFLYLGIIKFLMPEAKIIWTKRAMLDNCLSVYFLRLGPSMAYSTEIENIIHFYKQQERLMEHWKSLFGKDIYEFDYDKLISSPKKEITKLLSFTDLPWEDNCINFHKSITQVKTASVWQVRQPLYSRSSGRWKNYQEHLKPYL